MSHEDDEIDRLAESLERQRPVPTAAFRGSLRRGLLQQPGQFRRPDRRWRALAASYAGAGFLCLAVAAVGIAGVGPFGA